MKLIGDRFSTLAIDGRVARGPHRHTRVGAGTPLCLHCTCLVDDTNPTSGRREAASLPSHADERE